MRASCGGATFEIRPKRGFIPLAEYKRLIAEGWQSSQAERAFLRVTVDEGAHPSFVDILKIGALHLKTSPREDGLVWCELEPRLYVRGLQVDMQLAGFVWMPNKCWGKALPASELAELEAAASLVEADVRQGVESFSGRCAEPDTLVPPPARRPWGAHPPQPRRPSAAPCWGNSANLLQVGGPRESRDSAITRSGTRSYLFKAIGRVRQQDQVHER